MEIKIGQIIVDDDSIGKVIMVDNDQNSYTTNVIMSKETFVEAYKKWINPNFKMESEGKE